MQMFEGRAAQGGHLQCLDPWQFQETCVPETKRIVYLEQSGLPALSSFFSYKKENVRLRESELVHNHPLIQCNR